MGTVAVDQPFFRLGTWVMPQAVFAHRENLQAGTVHPVLLCAHHGSLPCEVNQLLPEADAASMSARASILETLIPEELL